MDKTRSKIVIIRMLYLFMGYALNINVKKTVTELPRMAPKWRREVIKPELGPRCISAQAVLHSTALPTKWEDVFANTHTKFYGIIVEFYTSSLVQF